MLYPKMTESRMVFDLNGVWDFALLNQEEKSVTLPGEKIKNSLAMPVPSSYNDIYQGRNFADHAGDMVYQRSVSITASMLKERLFLRFASFTHRAEVYWNGKLLGSHKGGFLPFEFEVTENARQGENCLTVFVNNIVDETTLPAGRLERYACR